MPDYTLGKIYIIQSPHTDKCYIGSTTQPRLCTRMSGHRTNANNNSSCTSKIVLGYGDAFITLIEKFPCADIGELNRREGLVALDYPTRINKNVAGRTNQESKNICNQKPNAIAGRIAYKNTPEYIALHSSREWKDKQNAKARAKTVKKREDAIFAAIMINDGNQNI